MSSSDPEPTPEQTKISPDSEYRSKFGMRPLLISFGDVVKISSSDWYVYVDAERGDSTGYWRLMTPEEQLALD